MKIEIKRIGINGEGIGYLNKIPVFVKEALIDEVVDAEIIQSYRNYKIATIKNIITKSEDRINPTCKEYRRCDGCELLHTTYKNQLQIKTSILKEALLKYSDLDVDFDIEESPLQYNYRNCLKLPFTYNHNKLSLGIYKNNSNIICPINKCLIHSKLLEELKDKVLDILNDSKLSVYDSKTKSGLRYLILREIGNRAHMCIVTGENKISSTVVERLNSIKEIVSIYQCINTSKGGVNLFSNKMIHLAGGKHLNFKIDGYKFSLSIKSFYQLNTLQAKGLYKYIISLLDDNQNLIVEAYSGIGAISLLANTKAKKIVGIEYVEDAVVNANVNAKNNHLNNVSFICGDAGMLIKNKFTKERIDTLIVDPPRSGLDENMLKAILSSNIKKIIYVSCNPATLAKNLNLLKNKYKLCSIKAFDMFPQTAHVESVTLLERYK